MPILSFNGYGYFGTETKFMQQQYFLNTNVYNLLASTGLNEQIFYYQNSMGDIYFKPNKVVHEFLGENVVNNKYRMYSCPTDNHNDFEQAVKRIVDYSGDNLVTSTNTMSRFVSIDGKTLTENKTFSTTYANYEGIINFSGASEARFSMNANNLLAAYYIPIFPEDFFIGAKMNTKYAVLNDGTACWTPILEIDYSFSQTSVGGVLTFYCTDVTIKRNVLDRLTNITAFNNIGVSPTSTEYEDTDNPYGGGGNSGSGGGDGTLTDPDNTDPVDIPSLPSVGAADLGFITMYNPSKAQLKDLSDFMWSNLFDLATYKKLFSDPMQSIIGLAIVPVHPTTSGSKNVMFGTIDSGVAMTTIGNQYVQLDCGSVDIEKWIGSFMDYSPYTKVSIYLPYIGIHELSADDIMGGSINVVYNIDVLSGACGCFIKHSSRGVLYSYNGSCITNIPLTSQNFSAAIQNAVSAVCSGAGIIAGIATGAAPVTAMSAAGLLNSAANTALNSKPSVQRSGSLGGSAGILSVQKPYVIIERPNVSVPASVQNYVGQTANITMSLGSCHGFTMCEYVHINSINATSEEIKEIEALLKEGVML